MSVGAHTGSVLAAARINDADSIARAIGERWNTWKNSRREWQDLRDEVRAYVFATDTKHTTNSKLPWRHTATLPKLCQIRDNLHANYMAAMFPDSRWLSWTGGDEDGEMKRRTIQEYMRNKTADSDFRRTTSQLVLDYIDAGNAFADVKFVVERGTDMDGNPTYGYVGPRLVRINPNDIVFNITASSFEDSPKIVRSIVSIGDLAKEAERNPENTALMDTVQQALETRRVFNGLGTDKGSMSTTDAATINGFKVDGFGSPQEYFESGMVELLEFEGDFYDADSGKLYSNHVIVVIDRLYVVTMHPIQNWTGKSLKRHVGWRERPDNLMAMGPLDNLVGLQYKLDHLENMRADVFDLIANPPLKVKGEVDDFEWGPFQRAYMDLDGDITSLAPDTTVLNADFQIQRTLDLMEEMAGAPKQAMGFRTPGEKTAFEIDKLDTAAMRVFVNKTSYFEEYFLEPLLNNMLESARRNLNIVDTLRVVDEQGVEEFLKIQREDLAGVGRLRPMGARNFKDRARQVQNLNNLMNSPLGQDPSVRVHISGKEMAKLVEQALGLEEYDIVQDNIQLFEQAETQRLMNTIQDAVTEESITPTEDPSDPETP